MIFTDFTTDDVLEAYVKAPDMCSYCKTPLIERPLVLWKLVDCELWLHAHCALNFAKHLEKDAVRAMQKA